MTETQDDTPETADETPAKRRGRHRRRHDARHWLFYLRSALVVCLMPLVFAVAAGVMIIDRQITAPSWITDRIEARADALLDGARLEFGAITMRIGRDLHPMVRLVDTQVVDEGGLILGRVPVVEGLISPRGIILQQDVLMQEVRLVGAQVNLRRAANGDVSLALSASGGDVRSARSMPALFEQLDQIFERPALEALETVSAEGLIVNFDDARAGRSWVVDGGTASLDLRGGQTAVRGSFSLLSGRAGVTQVNLSYVSPRGSPAAQMGLNLTDAVASDLAAQSPALSWLQDVDAPISAALRTSLDETGALGPLNAALEIGQGVIQPNPATAPVAFDLARAYFTYDPVRDRISFSDLSIASEWGSLGAEGEAYLREFRDGLPRALLAQFELRDVALNPPGFFAAPPEVPEATIDLRFRFDPFMIELGEAVVVDASTRLIAQGRAEATPEGWQASLDAQIDEITPQRLLDFWPVPIKPGSRRWFANNVLEGRLLDLTAGIRINPGRPRDLAFGGEFAEASVRYFGDLPPIRDGAGVVSMGNHQFSVSLEEGNVLAAEGGPLSLDGSTFDAIDLRLKPSPAILDLQLDGSLTATLSVVNQPPLRFLDRANLPVTIAEGRALTAGQIAWPLAPRPTPDSVVVAMRSDLSRVRTDRLIPGRQMVATDLAVDLDMKGIRIAGPVRVGDVSATGAWEQRFRDPARPGSDVTADVRLSQAFLDEFNIALPPGTVAGNGMGQLQIALRPQTPPRFDLRSDLLGMTVALPAVGWAKGPGTAGNLQITGQLGAVPKIDQLEISGGGLRALGRIDLNATGGLEAAAFSRVQIGDWMDAPITLRGRGAGQPVGVEIGGGTLDLRRARFGAGQGDSGPVTIALDRLQVTEGIALTGFRGDFRGQDGFRGEFSGRLNGQAAVRGAVAPRNGRSAVRLRGDDAGAVLQATGLLNNVVGGVIDLTLLPTGGAGTFDGFLDVRDIRVRDAPTIAALLDAISVVGLLQQLDGQGLSFTEVDARFRLTPDAVIVSEASAIGPGLGISIDGIYTLANRQIDMQGVVSPFYLVNSIGSFLTRRGEGLIGFNFTIGGTAARPAVSVNPLSALTPGMFREIFRRPAPELSQ